jgi:exopolysaccharide biosynthesis polyprenyl glycosylphosphotransferase
MILQRKRGLRAILVLAQGILITLVFVLCALITFSFFTKAGLIQIIHYPYYIFAITAGLFLESFRRDQTSVEVNSFEESFPRQLQLSFRQTIYAVGTLFCFLVITKDGTISRIFLALCLPMFYLTLLWSNRYLSRRLATYFFRGVRQSKVLLIGSPAKASSIARWLESKKILGIQTVGLLHDGPPEEKPDPAFAYLGPLSSVEQVIREHSITQVILLELPDGDQIYRKLIWDVESQGARMLIFNNLEEKLHHPVYYFDDDGYNFIGIRKEPLEDPFNRLAKRILDVVIALPVVLFLLPLVCVVVWIIQRINSPGPLILRQMRAGLQNNQFEIFKFRTMHVNNPSVTQQATRDDARIFRGGRILRQLSIDEMPQFWNVLQGKMSLVGPRPHLIEHNEQFAKVISRFPVRMVVKPGITGLAQVRGYRGEAKTVEAIEQRLKSDIEYLENWRLALDIMIILKTAVQMFVPPKTAY